MIEKSEVSMPFRTVDTNSRNSVFNYLEDVLDYYKTAENATLSEWPAIEKGYEPFQKNESFYRHAMSWFINRNINVIKHNKKNRYLSTFILAAEFPPTLGYGRLIEELVKQCGWLSLYRSPKDNLIDFIESIDINAYSVVQRQSLNIDSEGYYALLNLIEILSSIRYSLDSPENLDSVCAVVSEKNNWDLDLVLRVAHSYKDILIPPNKSTEQKPTPLFSYQLIDDGIDWHLFIKHNLTKKVSIPLPSSILLPRFTSGVISILSENENAIIEETSQLVKIEVQEGFLEIECSFQDDNIPVIRRNKGLQRIQFIISVKDTNARTQQLFLGQIKRNDPFLIFGKNGSEIISNTHLFKRGEVLRIIPLTDTIGSTLVKSPDFFQEEQTGNLPVFQTRSTQLPSIDIGKIELQFRSIPFNIKLREQTAWETTFNRSRKVISYFFSPMMEMFLEGELPEGLAPTIRLEKRITGTDGKENRIHIFTVYSQGIIRPIQPLPSPGQYTLTVAFGDDAPSSITFNLLPIKSIRIIEDKHICLKMYKSVKDFQLQGVHSCTSSFVDGLIDIHCLKYGKHDIEAIYYYKYSESQTLKSTIKFTFEAIEEVVGHFSKIVVPGSQEPLSLENDLIANSYLEFRRTSLRDSSIPYKISAYMEYSHTGMRIYPQNMVMYTEGVKPYSLASLVTLVRSNQYSRLLITVEIEKTELYRIEFLSNRRPILDLEKEWQQGAYSSLTAMPLTTLQPEIYQSLATLPTNCLVYGMVENAIGKQVIATFPTNINSAAVPTTEPVLKFLSLCNQNMKPTEVTIDLLSQILQSPEQSYKLLQWLSKANAWEFPYDIKVFAKLLDAFPVLVAWAEMARTPNNRSERFALCIPKAQREYDAGMLYTPELSRVINHPRFIPELITLKDLEILDELNLIPTEASLFSLFAFCCNPFISNGKPVLSWLTLFWLRDYCNRQGRLSEFLACFPLAEGMKIPLVTNIAKEYTDWIPTYAQDSESEQDLDAIFRDEQKHYLNPPLTRIPGLSQFLKTIRQPAFEKGLLQIIQQKPLFYAEPNLRGFITSTKWKSIIFLSLTAVSTQLNKQSLLKTLQNLWSFNHKTYVYLLKWLNNHEETTRIYNAYYEYWMNRFWEEKNV